MTRVKSMTRLACMGRGRFATSPSLLPRHFLTGEPLPRHTRDRHVYTFYPVTDLPQRALHHFIGGAIGRPNGREPLRLERQDRGADAWRHGIGATRRHVGAGAGDETQPHAERQELV